MITILLIVPTNGKVLDITHFSTIMTTELFKEGNRVQEKVEKALVKVRSFLQADGGDVELVEITEEGVVKVKLTGACGGCPMASMTLKTGIEKILKEEVPEVKRVEAA
ncbi:Fe/S biogenesis protein NfuA [subsurface metagenome]